MAVSLVIGAAVYIYFRSLACGIASFLTGVFLDIDHLFDYYLNYGLRFDLKDFYACCQERRFKTLTLIFHSYELLAIFWVSIFVFSLSNIWKAVAIGATQHLIFDQLTNVVVHKMDRFGYFLTFRLRHRFNKEEFIKGR